MNNNQWKVGINTLQNTFSANVYIYRTGPGWFEYLEIKSPDAIIHREKYEKGAISPIKPTFSCVPEDALNIAKGFVEYANSQGFKNGDETFVKGKLEATEHHLEDMRSLVFKSLSTNPKKL